MPKEKQPIEPYVPMKRSGPREKIAWAASSTIGIFSFRAIASMAPMLQSRPFKWTTMMALVRDVILRAISPGSILGQSAPQSARTTFAPTKEAA
jgi:hypothetical protein